MIALGVALITSLFLSLVGTPLVIKILRKYRCGQFIRQDGPTAHYTKRGTPTMGGLVIIFAAIFAWLVAHLVVGTWPSASGYWLLFLFVGLGFIGFLDDFIKISKQRSLGLNERAKLIGQTLVAVVFSVGILFFPNREGITPGSMKISVIREVSYLDLAAFGTIAGIIICTLWSNFLVAAWSNGVNLTDGLDGLATGASLFGFGAYTGIAVWQNYQQCSHASVEVINACYPVRDPGDLAVMAMAIVGACFGFLWWNTSPAQIFMGDTGALALGGAFAGLSILTHTEFLAVIIGGLFVIIVFSDVIQIGVFKMTRKRVFRMAPLHHHFELKGWPEVTIVVRFWIIAGLFAIVGVAMFYGEWVVLTK